MHTHALFTALDKSWFSQRKLCFVRLVRAAAGAFGLCVRWKVALLAGPLLSLIQWIRVWLIRIYRRARHQLLSERCPLTLSVVQHTKRLQIVIRRVHSSIRPLYIISHWFSTPNLSDFVIRRTTWR